MHRKQEFRQLKEDQLLKTTQYWISRLQEGDELLISSSYRADGSRTTQIVTYEYFDKDTQWIWVSIGFPGSLRIKVTEIIEARIRF